MEPIGRSQEKLTKQLLKCEEINKQILGKENEVETIVAEWNRTLEDGIVNQSQWEPNRMTIDGAKNVVGKARNKVIQRTRDIQQIRDDTRKLESNATALMGELRIIGSSDVLKSTATVSDPREHFEKLKQLKDSLKPIEDRIDNFVADCRLLIKTAGPETDTTELNNSLESVSNVWSLVSATIAEREIGIDAVVQQMGRYEDAHKALLNWLEETEEIMENQRPPASDAKVSKAQLHAYDVLLKHIEDKQASMKAFSSLIDSMTELNEDEKKSVKQKDQDVWKRYNNLLSGAQDRQARLMDAVDLAERLAEEIFPLDAWLTQTEKRLTILATVPTDTEKVDIKMREQKHIEEEITEKGKDVDQVLTIVPMLCALVKVEDAEELETQSNQLSRRYNSLAERNEKMRKLLADMAVQVQDFVQDANNLSTWLDDVEQELFEINELAIEPSDLIEQTNILSELAVAVAERDILVSNVMEVGRELCRQAIGDEAMALQNKIETLKLRYIDVMLVTDNKLAMLTKAIPLSEKFHEGFHAVMQWLEAVEEDLAQIDETDIETQAQLIFTMEEDIVKWRPEIDDLVAVSTQLQALSSPERAEELFQNTVEMNRRVNHIADKVARRAERMDVAEKQSRNVHNELDYLVEWLADARERVITAGPPSIDPEYVKAQLKNQLIMNEDVTANKTRLREMIAEAKNISRQIDSEYGKATLIERCDQGKELIDEVASLCMDRTECLERALALAQQLTQEFEKLTSWVDQVDNELRSAPEITTATPPAHLKRMHDHNTELTGAIIAYKPLMDQFEEDVKALREICIEEDGVKLGELAEEIVTKYHEVRDAVRARGQALDSTLDFTSGLGERLDTFVQNLQGSTERLKQNEMISSDPAVLENRIAEIQLILDNLHEKEIAYGALRDSAAELLATAPEGDVAAKDVSNKLDLLSKLWLDVELEAVNRRNFLEDVLVKAKYFWNELDQCQKAVDDLSVHLESIEPAVGQPDQLQIQQTVMHKMADDISSVEPRILGLRQAGAIFSSVISREDQAVIDSQIDVVQNGWSTITKLFTDKNRQLIVAMEEAISFHDEFAKLLTWLDRAELHLESLPAADNLKLDDIPEHLEVLHRLKDDVDQHAVIKEQLSQAAIQIAAGASAHQATAIRQPINEMNTRWTRLFASLSDKEYKVECALLQMGRLSDAVDQMIAWMNKTRATLSELEVAGPVNFRQIEIQLCKLTVITNDVQSHEPSLLALNTAVQRLIKDESNSESTKNIDQMNTKWKELKEVLENLAKQMDKARSEAENVGGEIEHWSGWLEDIEIQLTTTKPTGGLPETAESQMDDFRVLRAEVEQNKISLERYIYDTDRYLSEHGNDMESWISRNHTQIKAKWIKIKELCIDREKKLQLALEEAIALSVSMKDTTDWINSAEQKLAGMSPVSRLKGPLTKQIEEYEQWMEEVAIRKQLMVEQQAAGTRLQYYCEKKDAIPIKNGLVSLKHRFEKIATRTTERSKKLNAAFEESRVWLEGLENLENWMSGIEGRILEETPHTSSVDRLKEQLETIKEVHKDITMRQPQFDITRKRGITVTEHAPRSEVKQIKDRNDELMRRWNTLTQKATEKQQRAEQAVLEGGVFEEAMLKLESWVDGELEKDEMGNNEKLLGDVDTVRELIEDDQKRSAERKAKKMGVETVLRKADEMLARGVEESESVREATSRLKEKWSRVEEAADKRSISLNKAEYYASDFDYKAHALLDWLAETESKLKFRTTDLSSALATIESVKRDLNAASQKRDACVAAGKTIQDKCHPRAEQPMKYWLRVVNSRWKEVEERASEKEFTLLEEEQREKECQEAIKGLLDFVTKKRKELLEMLAQEAPQDLDTMSKMQRDHEQFEFDLRERQSEVDSAIKGAKKGLRLRSAIADQLSAEWKQLWLDSMGYQSSLEAQRDLLEEMYRLEGWKWEDWKERYVEWNDHRKARVSDLFRRIDRNHTGNVPREVFIDAILASKFPTSRLEMDKVADLFDKGDRMISSKEFIDALRFDRTNRHQKPLTDHEKVNEEITKQKDACSCCNQFKIEKISDGHYRFGDTQIKRMVRILRSTVMVRVGGGWEALDEFLNKHDPCRAKGRLNIDMIYKDVAPSTAIDTMRAFTKGRRARPISQGTPGPIMKIREKTELSLPMFPHNRANSDVGSGFGATDPRLGRPSRTNSRNSIFDTPSRPASRNSETNDSDRPSRIPSLRGKKGIRYNLPSNLK